MKQLRWRIGALAVWLVLVFNIERIDFSSNRADNPIDISTFVYILVAATTVAVLLLSLRKRQLLLFSLVPMLVYIAIKVPHTSQMFGSINTYITVTEVLALLGTVALAGLVGESLRDFEGAVEAISMPKVNERLMREDKARSRMSIEMRRARRHARPISAVAIDVDPATYEATLHQAVRDVQVAMVERYAKMRLGAFLARRVRETDLVVQQQQPGRFLLLAPETPAEQTREFMKRLEHETLEQLGLRFHFGVADFPGSALTSEDLILRAEEALQATKQTTSDGNAPSPAPAS